MARVESRSRYESGEKCPDPAQKVRIRNPGEKGARYQLTCEISLLIAAAEEPGVLHELCLLVVGLPPSQTQPEEVLRLLSLVQNLGTQFV